MVELASPTDEGPREVRNLRRKMRLFQAHGARLGWLLLPEERAVEIWRGGQQGMAERLQNPAWLEGGEDVAGLLLALIDIWGGDKRLRVMVLVACASRSALLCVAPAAAAAGASPAGLAGSTGQRGSVPSSVHRCTSPGV